MSTDQSRKRVLTKWARKHLPEPRFQVVDGVVLEPHRRTGVLTKVELTDHADATWWEFNHNRREVELKGAFGVAEIDALEARIRKVWPRELAKVADPASYHFHGQLEVYELDHGDDARSPFMPHVLACYGVRCFRRVPDYDFAARALAPPGDHGWCRLSLEEHRAATVEEAIGYLAGKLNSIGTDFPAEWITGPADPIDRIGKLVNKLNSTP